MNKNAILSAVLVALALSGCKGGSQTARPDDASPAIVSVKQQEDLAMKKMTEILESTAGRKAEENLPVIEAGYREIMRKYPDSFMAEEGYYRLMVMNLRDIYPPNVQEAENIYREYFKRYRNPRIGMSMTGDLARFYYLNGMWEKLSRFTLPYMKEYARSGRYGDTVFLFLYTEARFHLNDLEEARRGYKIVLKNAAVDSSDYKIAITRLDAIEKALAGEKEAGEPK